MNKKTPIHFVQDTGYFEPHVDTYCNLGDSYDKGYENGSTDWSKVTCKKCLKHKPPNK